MFGHDYKLQPDQPILITGFFASVCILSRHGTHIHRFAARQRDVRSTGFVEPCVFKKFVN